MDKAPDYVKNLWQRDGFIVTHKEAVRIELIEEFRSYLLQGLGGNGFRNALIEKYKRNWFLQSILWRSYIDYVR